MAMKEYSTFPKAPALLEPHHQIVQCPIQYTHLKGGGLTSFAEKQSVYSTASINWSMEDNELLVLMSISLLDRDITFEIYQVIPLTIPYSLSPIWGRTEIGNDCQMKNLNWIQAV